MPCEACKAVPWGPQGWKDFFLNESFRSRLHYIDFGNPYRSIAYDISSHQFYSQARTCEWCQLLSNELKTPGAVGDALRLRDLESTQEQITNIGVTIRFLRSQNVRPERLAIIRIDCLASTDGGFTHFTLRLGAAARSGGPASEVFVSPAPPGSEFNSEDEHASGFRADLARRWLSDCTQHHSSPCSSNTSVELPTRLLCLCNAEDGSPRVALRETETGERGSYACLSYSWGTREGLQAEFARLGRRLSTDSLPLDSLPPAFRDALQVCRALDLQYLWVDALCIQQGDEADKSRELRAMHLYYGNARLVIQPSGTTSVDEGFLGSSRIPKLSQYLYSNNGTHNDDVGYIKVSFVSFPQDSDHDLNHVETDEILLHELRDPSSWYYSWGDEVAASRGWILQEELLCTRILTFPSTGGMTFRCIGSDDMLTDGNVFCHPEHNHQPLTFPKLRLWHDSGPDSLGLQLLPDHVKGMLQQARKLVAVGTNHALVSVSGKSGTLHLNHNFSEPLVVPQNGFVVATVYTEASTTQARSVSPYAALLILPPLDPSNDPSPRSLPIYTDPPPHTITPAGANRAWLRTVDNYCRRKLTNASDKMPAIAALAREYSARYGEGLGRYVVGVWEAFVAEGLCWRVPTTRIAPLPASQRAPSWSWATVEGACFGHASGTGEEEEEYDLNWESIEIKIKKVALGLCPTAEEEPPSEYEAVAEGVLEMEGKLLDCHWLKVPAYGGGHRFVLVEKESGEETAPISWTRSSVLLDAEEYATEEEQGTVRFLLVRRSNRGIGEHDDHVEGLLLKPVGGAEHRYKRVGFASWNCKKSDFEEGVALRLRQEILELI